MMKKLQFRRGIFLIAAILTAALSANAQVSGLKKVEEYYDPSDGSFIYNQNDQFGNLRRESVIDNIVTGQLDGSHWDGKTVATPNGQDITGVYLVNKATGEYLVLGDSWGTTPMSDYAGTMFNLRGGYVCRADTLKGLADFQVDGEDPTLGDKAYRLGKGYLIQYGNDDERCIGRLQFASGDVGAFEQRAKMVDRSFLRKEYALNPDDKASSPPGNNDDGQMIFYFHPVTGLDGKQYYVIYTHRQTTAPLHESFYDQLSGETQNKKEILWRKLVEYGNRDSYLCLRSTKSDISDYNDVGFKKFAGRMYYGVANNGKEPWIAVPTGIIDPDTEEEIIEYEENPDYESWADTYYYYEQFSPSASGSYPRPASTSTSFRPMADWASAKGDDESAFEENGIQNVSLGAGLATVCADESCLWKIVTYEEREAYRIAASKTDPVDMSFLIKNHKFYPTYLPYDIEGLPGLVGSKTPNFGWEWHDNETGQAHHEHSYKSSGIGTEFHKIGTHYYDRWGWGEVITTTNNNLQKAYWRAKTNERTMTQGEEANYVGSIFNGSAALRQTITGLRPGNYIVYCRAFYAPFSMQNLGNPDGFIHKDHVWDELADDMVYQYTYYPSKWWNGDSYDDTVPTTVAEKIDPATLSNQSFFFAIGKGGVERKRDVPCIFAGMLPLKCDGTNDEPALNAVSKDDYSNYTINDKFALTPLGESISNLSGLIRQEKDPPPTDPEEDPYEWVVDPNNNPSTVINNQIGHTYGEELGLLKDATVFAMVEYNSQKYVVPRNLTGAARFFELTDAANGDYGNAFNYRIGLPVEVGTDGKLTIGIDHIKGADGEWVCFDNFELVYYGVDEHYEFVCDQDNPKNNSIKEDFFGWTAGANSPPGESVKAEVIIKRGLSTEKYVSLILPVSLTKKQAKQAFGDNVKITYPSRLLKRTIVLDSVQIASLGDDDIVMHAGVPYAVKPSAAPALSENETWKRTEYSSALSPWTLSGWSPLGDKKIYVPNEDRNNALQNAEITGPIYIASDVTITSSGTFPRQTTYANDVRDNGVAGRKSLNYYLPSEEWKAIGTNAPFFACGENDPAKGAIGNRYTINTGDSDKQYKLVALGYYNKASYKPLEGTPEIPFNQWTHESATSEGKIPPYSYYLAGGELVYNGEGGSTAPKGLGFYLQIWEAEPLVEIVNQFAENVGPNLQSWNGWGNNLTSSATFDGNRLSLNTKNASNQDYAAFNKGNYAHHRHLVVSRQHTGARNNTETTTTITITAPNGYKIDGYKIGGYCHNAANETYTLTAAGGASINITEDAVEAEPICLETSRLDVASTTLTLTTHTTTWDSSNNYAVFPVFIVYLKKASAGGGAKVFTGNMGDFEWVLVDNEVNGITETFRERENPANDLYYDLMGRPVKTPRKNGIYIYRGKKIVY